MRHHSAVQLADEVLARMTLEEKLGVVDLANRGGYENMNTGVPRLCIPALTLQDGPDGIGARATGVTQLPASIATAATFDTSLARRYGMVLGSEAKGQGVDVVQGPNLNLARVPEGGRIFEGFGEDPALASAMAAAEIEGMQAKGTMANAKHFTAYTQETARMTLNQLVSDRALEEVYFAPFRAAVEKAHLASVMCAYGQIDATYACADSALYGALKSWGFWGFVRSDLGAAVDPVAAFAAGLDAIKPDASPLLGQAVFDRALPLARLNSAVRAILTEMFRFGLVAHPPTGRLHTDVATSSHAEIALAVAEHAIVLLKNAGGLLPLGAGAVGPLAVIGADAGTAAQTAGGGGASVVAPFVITPADALSAAFTSALSETPAVPAGAPVGLFPASLATAASMSVASPPAEPETRDSSTATAPENGPGWADATWNFTPPTNGTFEIAMRSEGDAFLSLDGTALVDVPGEENAAIWSKTVTLDAGESYSFALSWYRAEGGIDPTVTALDVDDAISSAVAAAAAADVAVVFVSDNDSEGYDRPGLELPGYDDALISAVAAVNPRTVVVLNTGGAVLMPWLSKVAAVLEAWYPGQEDGAAIAAVLSGAVDPSGHLPITFPATDNQEPPGVPGSFPGVGGDVAFSEGLDIGYRQLLAEGLTPLFPFGYGLSYTTFSLGRPRLGETHSGVTVSLRVSNTGRRLGTEVVQAYLVFPSRAGEPPRQLEAFTVATVRPRASRQVTLDLPRSDFEAYLSGRFQTVPGTYTIEVGQSSVDLPLRLRLSAPGAS